jgi:large subunit ribosomal protein L28
MAKFCEVCNKGAMNGNKVSHSNRKSKRRLYPNVQNVRAMVDGRTKRITVCTRCLRSGKVERALPKFSVKEMLAEQAEQEA